MLFLVRQPIKNILLNCSINYNPSHYVRYSLKSKNVFRQLARPFTTNKNKLLNCNKFKILFASTSPVIAVAKCFIGVAQCENAGTRIVGIPSETHDPSFDWRKFFSLLQPYTVQLVFSILAALLAAFLNILIPKMSGEIINVIAHSGTDLNSFLSRIKAPAFRFAMLDVLLAVATFIYIDMLSRVGEGIAKTLKTELFSSILKQDIAFFDERRTGELMNRLTVDVGDFKSAFKMVVSQGLRTTTQIVGCSVTLFFISPQLTYMMLIGIPSVIVVGTVFGSFLRVLSGKAKAQSMKVTLVADEAISNIRTVRAFAMESSEVQLFDGEADKMKILNERLGTGIAIFQAASGLFMNGVILSTFYAGGCLMAEHKIAPGDLVAFLTALQILQRSITQLALLFGTYIKGIHAGARVFDMIRLEPTMKIDEGKTIPYHTLIPNVVFQNVTFAYPSRPNQDVLKDFSMEVPVGKTVALVGSSGSGKSTISWLLQRFYDIPKGDILVGGQSLKDLNQKWLRGRVIGLISQEPVLFATTIMENIRYGRQQATDQEVIEAAKLANAHEFISRFPDGYNTVVGERGTSVSGGQKQRIAIARALLKNPSILILDEATSALDTESEKLVQTALEQVVASRTTIVIAHRLSTIKNADLIVVLNNGIIVESGTHKELMARKGVYAKFVEQQKLSGQE